NGYLPTGTVTFNLYDNPSGTGSPLFTDTEPLSNGSATSASYTPSLAGTYYWVATYSGDARNNPASSGTAHEPVVVAQAPGTATIAFQGGNYSLDPLLDGGQVGYATSLQLYTYPDDAAPAGYEVVP